MWESPPLHRLEEAIESPSNPIGMRMRAAYFLRQAYDNAVRNQSSDDSEAETNGEEESNSEMKKIQTVIETLGKGLSDERHGSLLRHEFAYVMGQLRDERCCPKLEEVLSNNADCVMVRHECAEALGAIGAIRSIPILRNVMESNKGRIEIYETCQIAIAHMQWRLRQDKKIHVQEEEKKESILNPTNSDYNYDNEEETNEEEPMACACMISPYSSIDPAPPHPKHVHLSTTDIGQILQNSNLPLFERYRAMFSLRNRGGEDAVLELCRTLVADTSSALLRHEIAYVLGQMQHPASIDALGESLRRSNEHEMVRHESAEALGAIDGGDRWMDCEKILTEFSHDDDVVVRESCIVALDAADYWGHSNVTNDEDEDDDDDDDLFKSHVVERKNINDENKVENLLFGKQKAVTNGKMDQIKREALLNHFNLQK